MTDVAEPDIRECEVCSRVRQVYVSCCGFGAMSLAYCSECLANDAEPEFGFIYLWDWVADRDRTALKPEISHSRCWKDGRYWTWDEWVDNELKNPRPLPVYPDPPTDEELAEVQKGDQVDFTDLADLGFDVVEAKSDES